MSVWKNVWLDQSKAGPRKIFSHRLFLDGYSVIKRYFSGEEKNILEVGAGSGRFGLALARDFPKIQVTITDFLPESISMIKKLAEELNLENVSSQQEDVLKLSFPDNSFDVVLAEALIQHLKFPENALAEMVRVLKPGGKLIVSAINWWNPHTIYKWWRSKHGGYEYGYEKSYTRDELKTLLQHVFVDVKAIDGFSVGYGLYRLKNYHQFWSWFGRIVNRLAKIVDAFTNRLTTKLFAFQLVVVAEKRILKTRWTETIYLQSFNDYDRGLLTVAETGGRHIKFDLKRVYFISQVPNIKTERGGHAHREIDQFLIASKGSFLLRLDDGINHQDITLNSPMWGIRVGPGVWHTLGNFSADCLVTVGASDYYRAEDYIFDYQDFLNWVADKHD